MLRQAHWAASLRSATAPVLAEAIGAGKRVLVLSTYASLPVVADAHAGRELPRWDLVIIDEAHRTAGRGDGVWKTVHSDEAIPARRRLYMTATPRRCRRSQSWPVKRRRAPSAWSWICIPTTRSRIYSIRCGRRSAPSQGLPPPIGTRASVSLDQGIRRRLRGQRQRHLGAAADPAKPRPAHRGHARSGRDMAGSRSVSIPLEIHPPVRFGLR